MSLLETAVVIRILGSPAALIIHEQEPRHSLALWPGVSNVERKIPEPTAADNK